MLAKALKCSRTTVNRWEKGLDPPSDEKIRHVARVLKLREEGLRALKRAGRSAMRVQRAEVALVEAAVGLVRERGSRYRKTRRKTEAAEEKVAKALAAMSPGQFQATLERALHIRREQDKAENRQQPHVDEKP